MALTLYVPQSMSLIERCAVNEPSLIDCSLGLCPGIAFQKGGAFPGGKNPRPEAGAAEVIGGAILYKRLQLQSFTAATRRKLVAQGRRPLLLRRCGF
jgi:hypothetical protein